MDVNRSKNGTKYCTICEKNINKAKNQVKLHYKSKSHTHNVKLFRKHINISQHEFDIDTKFIIDFSFKKKRKRSGIREKISEVFITGLPEKAPKGAIRQYFSKYGPIEMVYINPAVTSLTIQYVNEFDARRVVRMPHIIEGKELVVRFDNTEPQYSGILPHEIQMLHRIQNRPRLDMQIGKFVEYLTANDSHMVTLYEKLKSDMTEIMGKIFPSCVIWPFGSAITCLQFVSSNIDLFVEIQNDEDCLEKARKALTNSFLFESVILSHPDTNRVPYVVCNHIETKVRCALNFKNSIAVKSSELIKYYVGLNTKIRPFILVIKYWAKTHELTGKKELLTNYSLVILCIFYLQQKHAFPSVRLLQHGTCPTDPRIDWNTNISTNALNIEGFELKISMRALVEGFFSFYTDFNYAYIISPYIGAPVEKILFSSRDTIPEEFHVYKGTNLWALDPLKCDTAICVQDPIEHNVNICSMVSSNALCKYVTMCTLALSKFSDDNETNMLHRLFSKNEKINDDLYSVCIWGKVTDASPLEEIDFKQRWFHQIKYFLVTVFEKIFKFDMNIESNEENRTLYRATCFMDVWTVRDVYANKIKDKLDQCRTILAKEMLLSESIWSSSTIKTPNSSELFRSFVQVSYQENPSKVFIKFDSIGIKDMDKESYVSFLQFFKINYGIWFERYMKELDEIF